AALAQPHGLGGARGRTAALLRRHDPGHGAPAPLLGPESAGLRPAAPPPAPPPPRRGPPPPAGAGRPAPAPPPRPPPPRPAARRPRLGARGTRTRGAVGGARPLGDPPRRARAPSAVRRGDGAAERRGGRGAEGHRLVRGCRREEARRAVCGTGSDVKGRRGETLPPEPVVLDPAHRSTSLRLVGSAARGR